MRNRLTQRVAADATADKGTGIMNDPYQVNNPEHEKNDPAIGEYAKGDPSAWGEDVNRDGVGAEKDKRDPATHIPEITAKMAAEAIQAGRKLEERAVKCIVASQRILPGADDTVIEAQAADLMQLPDPMIDSLLGRQEDLASSIAKYAAETCEKADNDDEDKAAAGKTPEQLAEEAKEAEETKELMDRKAALEAELSQLDERIAGKGEIPAGLKAYQDEQRANNAGVEADKPKPKGEKADKPEGDKPEGEEDPIALEAAKAKTDDKAKTDGKATTDDITFGEDVGEKGVDASQNLLDDIFSGVIASDTKKGAKSLSGLVKKEASEGKDPLAGMWDAPPDVSAHFQ